MTEQNYLFHFKISPKFNDYINYLMEKLNFKSNCRMIDYILELSSVNIRKIKEVIGDHKSEYEFVDIEDPKRIDKYVRLKVEKYKMLKKWHYIFNEYGISVILRDIIAFFYEGIIKYGVEKFLNIIGRKLKVENIKIKFMDILTHMNRIPVKKRALFSYIIDNLPVYV
ncbi:MAG: hypothetical protein KA885_02895 [Spirochaetes bacterium]|nr:hypothetical protein [Spirochaetota bacterium]